MYIETPYITMYIETPYTLMLHQMSFSTADASTVNTNKNISRYRSNLKFGAKNLEVELYTRSACAPKFTEYAFCKPFRHEQDVKGQFLNGEQLVWISTESIARPVSWNCRIHRLYLC